MKLSTVVSMLAFTGGVSLISLMGCGVQSETDYCAAKKERYDTCPYDGNGKTKPAFDSTKCSSEYQCTTTAFQTSFVDEFLRCKTNKDCTVKAGDNCYDQAAQKGSNTSEADVCAKKYAECKSQGKSFSDDYCTQIRAYNADLLDKMMACLEKPCDQISACLKSTADTALPACN